MYFYRLILHFIKVHGGYSSSPTLFCMPGLLSNLGAPFIPRGKHGPDLYELSCFLFGRAYHGPWVCCACVCVCMFDTMGPVPNRQNQIRRVLYQAVPTHVCVVARGACCDSCCFHAPASGHQPKQKTLDPGEHAARWHRRITAYPGPGPLDFAQRCSLCYADASAAYATDVALDPNSSRNFRLPL